jgi:hypothetical protein
MPPLPGEVIHEPAPLRLETRLSSRRRSSAAPMSVRLVPSESASSRSAGSLRADRKLAVEHLHFDRGSQVYGAVSRPKSTPSAQHHSQSGTRNATTRRDYRSRESNLSVIGYGIWPMEPIFFHSV